MSESFIVSGVSWLVLAIVSCESSSILTTVGTGLLLALLVAGAFFTGAFSTAGICLSDSSTILVASTAGVLGFLGAGTVRFIIMIIRYLVSMLI